MIKSYRLNLRDRADFRNRNSTDIAVNVWDFSYLLMSCGHFLCDSCICRCRGNTSVIDYLISTLWSVWMIEAFVLKLLIWLLWMAQTTYSISEILHKYLRYNRIMFALLDYSKTPSFHLKRDDKRK